MPLDKRVRRTFGNNSGALNNTFRGLSRIIPTASSAPFTPTDIAGCKQWLRSDLGVTLNGSTVSAWTDQTGNGYSMTQGTATNQPTYSSSDANFNSQPSIYFDGSNDFMAKGAAGWPSMSYMTIFFVVKLDSTVFNGYQVLQWGNSGGKAVNINGNGSSGEMQFWFSYPTISNKTVRVLSSVPTTTCYLTGKCAFATANTSWSTYLNGTSGGSDSSANNGSGATNDSGTALYMGSYQGGGGGYAKFYIAEMIVYDSILGTTDQTNVENYIKARYNL